LCDGVRPRVAQELLRHGEITLTRKVYTDPSQLPLAEALATLPVLKVAPLEANSEPNNARATGGGPKASRSAFPCFYGQKLSQKSGVETAPAEFQTPNHASPGVVSSRADS
jgi:hypothetical protein